MGLENHRILADVPDGAKVHMDPIGIGVLPSLLYAAFADGICTVLLIVGLGKRWAALFSFINIAVAWPSCIGHEGEHGELIVLYLSIMLALMLPGAGSYSLDKRLLDT
jgi:putative oxidoreductase